MSTEVDLARRLTYDYFYMERLRFSDTDMIGHVNNVAFAALMESGRTHYTRSGVIQNLSKEFLFVMRRMELEYRAELHWPADVDVGARLLRIGRTSFVLGTAVFQGEVCAATCSTTLVLIGRKSRRPEIIPEEVRAGMERYLPVTAG